MDNESFENLHGAQNTGTVTHVFSNIISSNDFIRCSDVFQVGGLQWKTCIQAEKSDRTENEKYLGVYVYCNWEDSSSLWSCKAECEIRLLTACKDTKGCPMVKFVNIFNRKSTNAGRCKFTKFEDIIKSENEYIKEDKITIETKIRIVTIRGFHKVQLFDFETHNPRFSDGTITVKNRQFFVGRMYLSMCSSYFNAKFTTSNDLVLIDVDPDEFLNVLHLIHSSNKKINAKNYEFSLKLSKKFDIPMLIIKCVDFLTSEESSEISIFKKLDNAYTYKLSKLQAYCFGSLKTMDDVVQLTKLKEYENSSDGVQLMLFERMLEVYKQ